MFLSLFKQKPLLDPNTTQWITDTFAWALEHFELSVFKQDSQLILPSNKFYPGNVSSVHEMAQSVFENTLKYAGMQNWPIVLVEPQAFSQKTMPQVELSTELRGQKAQIHVIDGQSIEVSYNPNQINQPQDLVASFAQAFATILLIQSQKLPPGGKEFVPQSIDLIACFMGFGVMFANTAYQFKGGCGSCYNPYANRTAALSEQEVVYCLALFSLLKSISAKEVTSHLKSHLRSDFKKAIHELKGLLSDTASPALLAAAN
jgi:hypothetical protein